LALEAAELARRYRTKRSQTEKSLRGRGLSNPTVMPGLLQHVDHDEQAALSKLVGRWRRELTPEQQAEFDNAASPETSPRKPAEPNKPKASTERGDARKKIIPALTLHPQYRDGGCGNSAPIGVRALAKKADVSPDAVSAFFKKEFGSHAKYKAACYRDLPRVAMLLKMLNEDYIVHPLFGSAPPEHVESEEDGDE
jgi:hypothetical protein